jgi:hypothetical protein
MSKHITRNNSRNPLMISWDNPVPANSKRMIRQLKKHGRVGKSEPKTTVALTPHGHTDWRRIRRAIVRNLHPSRGERDVRESQLGKSVRIRTQHKLHMEACLLRQTANGRKPRHCGRGFFFAPRVAQAQPGRAGRYSTTLPRLGSWVRIPSPAPPLQNQALS